MARQAVDESRFGDHMHLIVVYFMLMHHSDYPSLDVHEHILFRVRGIGGISVDKIRTLRVEPKDSFVAFVEFHWIIIANERSLHVIHLHKNRSR